MQGAPLVAALVSGLVAASGPAAAEMVYLHQEGDSRRVALAKDDGTLVRLLTPADQQAYHPEISADGRHVAYSIGTITRERVDVAIHVQDLETGDVEVWTPSGDQYIHAEFSGDGRWLAYSGPVGAEGTDGGAPRQAISLIDLHAARAAGPARTEVRDGRTWRYYEPAVETLPGEADAFFPALAANGGFVVYHRTHDTRSHETAKELVLYDRRDGSTRRLTEAGGHAMVPSLSWDDRTVAFASTETGQWDVHVIDLWTDERWRVTDTPEKEFTPVFAPDGSITYTRIADGDAPELDLYRIAAEQVFDREKAAQPTPFVAEPQVAEYIPAFSGATDLVMEQVAELPEPARSSFGAATHKGKVYVAGGHQGAEHRYPPESFLDRLDIYDPKTGTWRQGASMSVPRHGFEMVAHDGYLYAFGGFAYSAEHDPGWRSLDIIERYDIAADRWEVLDARLPRPRSSNVAAAVGDTVFLIGGWDSTPQSPGDKEGDFHAEIDVFDLKSETASVSEHRLPDPLRRAFTGVVDDGRIIVLGGITQGRSHFDWVDRASAFNPATGAWSDLAPLPFPTFAPGAGVYGGTLHLFGGMTPNGRYRNTIYALDLSSPDAWANTGRYLAEEKGFPIVSRHPDGGLLIMGGHSYGYEDGARTDSPVATVTRVRSTAADDAQ
ncbi:kelch-like 1 protein [Caenispirillum salinarum AK4]|uniref:Kelch-like 1 protein n=1 Tax=Caenispirillum salinarum AK4 TaxID=1238182 RepID=K9HG86_9PROT|nr:kelch repeat-containing protein [Caenispirillum salinarum]EKV29478.1 kelch-like 1 protein [Caenispirillum salinarum AK4]